MAANAPVLRSAVEGRWTPICSDVIEVAGGWRLPAAFASPEAEAQAARDGVVLGDATPRGKLLVQGDTCAQVAHDLFRAAPDTVGQVVVVAAQGTAASLEVSRLRPDLLYVGTAPEDLTAARAALRARAASGQVTVTDVTHGRFELHLIGPLAASLLSRVCGLDFHAASFPAHHAAQTSVAKVAQLIVRVDAGDLPAYRLVGGRSLGAYVWDTLMAAGRDLSVSPIGWQAMQAI